MHYNDYSGTPVDLPHAPMMFLEDTQLQGVGMRGRNVIFLTSQFLLLNANFREFELHPNTLNAAYGPLTPLLYCQGDMSTLFFLQILPVFAFQKLLRVILSYFAMIICTAATAVL